ncbi:hypothetical protein KJ969_05305, partial [Patescibacteria group bacterium]|nr:hypothetical protein [Patescibacteria group bacterium]
ITLDPDKISPDGTTTVKCLVRDNTTLAGIAGYVVYFYNTTDQIAANSTNATGWAIAYYSHPTEGSETIYCNITDNSTIYYNRSVYEKSTSLTIEVGSEQQGCDALRYVGGSVSGSCASLAADDSDYLNWSEILDSASDNTYYVEVDSQTDQPAEVITKFNFTWDVNRVVKNFLESTTAPSTGSMTYEGGAGVGVTFDSSDSQFINCTEVTAGGTKKRFINGLLHFYVPELDTEVTYTELTFNMVAQQDNDLASGDSLVFDVYNFGTSTYDTMVFTILDAEVSWTNYTYSLTTNPENYIDTDGHVQISMTDTHNQNGETVSNWLVDRIEVTAYYDNPSTNNVYNYTLGYVNQSSGQKVRLSYAGLNSTDGLFSAALTSDIANAVSLNGNVTAYLTLREEGTPTVDTERRTDFSIDYFNLQVSYDSASVRNLTVTILNTSQQTFANAVISIKNQSGTELSTITLGGSINNLTDVLIYNRIYDVEQTIPLASGNMRVVLQDLNITNNLNLGPQVVANYTDGKPSIIDNVTPLYALDDSGLDFAVAELIIPKAGSSIDQILHCVSWSYSNANCTSWEVNETDDFNVEENSTHFWFNVTSFDTFGGGGGSTLPTLTEIRVYNVTGQADTHDGGTLVASGLNTTFDLLTGRKYRVEFHITNEGISWDIDAADQLFHDGLNSSWTLDAVNDVWYTDDGGDTNYTGGTWSNGNVSWDASLGGRLKNGEEGIFSYVINTSGGATEKLQVYFLVNDTSKNAGSQDYSIYNVTKLGWLNVTLNSPAEDATTNVRQNYTLTINATVTCEDGYCANVYATARYNASTTEPDTKIPTTPAKPFNITDNPNPQECSANPLTEGESCTLTWTVNATGDIDSMWDIDAYFNSTLTGVTANHTSDATVKIIKGAVVISLGWNLVDFDIVNPNTFGNNASENNLGGYNITVGQDSLDLDGIYILGTNLIPQTYSGFGPVTYGIAVSNITWNDEENDYADPGTTRLTQSYALMRSSVPAGTVITTYYWIDAPSGQYAQEYRGNLTIMANATL